MKYKKMFEYLNSMEHEVCGFRFNRGYNNSLVISMGGYEHMDLQEVENVLINKFRLKYCLDSLTNRWDAMSGTTRIVLKNVYPPNLEVV